MTRKFTEEHKAKISAALKGRVFSESHRRNISTAHIGVFVVPRAERLARRTLKTDSCWIWKGGKFKNGYGQFEGGVLAHRVAWEVANNQPVPEGMCVCHKCDNPLCVNPEHLFIGTHSENMQDCVSKGRLKTPFKNNKYRLGIKLTEETKLKIRQAKNTKKASKQYGNPPRIELELSEVVS